MSALGCGRGVLGAGSIVAPACRCPKHSPVPVGCFTHGYRRLGWHSACVSANPLLLWALALDGFGCQRTERHRDDVPLGPART